MDFNAPPPDDEELPALVAELIALAESFDLDIRRSAIERLYELAFKVGPQASAAIPQLIAALLDADPKSGESASWALKYCAPDSIEDLVECVRHERAQVRERAAHALGNIGDPCRAAAAPVLRALLRDEGAAVRKRAAWALGLVHDTSADTVRTLAQVAAHGTTGERSCLESLGGDQLGWRGVEAAIARGTGHPESCQGQASTIRPQGWSTSSDTITTAAALFSSSVGSDWQRSAPASCAQFWGPYQLISHATANACTS